MDAITNWFIENQNLIIEMTIKFIAAIAIFIAAKILAKLATKSTQIIMKKRGIDQTVISFISGITYGLVMIIGFIVAISHLGFNTSSLVAIIGAAGLAIGLALQGSLSNFASGILLISFKPFKSGDFVEVSGVAGIIEEIKIFSTRLRTGDNKTVFIPNGSITSGSIVNYSMKPTRRIDLVIGVSYNANLADVKTILLEAVNKNTLILKDEPITIGVSELADSSVNLVVRPWVKTENYWPAYFELLETIKVNLDTAGIEIPFPQLSVHVNSKEQHEN